MSDSDKEEKITQFVGVTGVDTSRARFYLEAAAWDLQLAMSSFFDGGAEDALPADDVSMVTENEDVSMPTDSARNPPASSGNSNRVGNINYLNVDSESSEEEGEAYYAGGSETSGQQVLGPPKKKKDPKNVVESLFKSARDHGAEEKREDEGAASSKKRPTFQGSGYRLGETSEDSTLVQGAALRPGAGKKTDKKLKLWKNGFSIGDGPLRDYNDPVNKLFLDSIARGEVPQELVREAQGGEVNLDMEDHRAEDFVKAKVSVQAFGGKGNMLDSDDAPPYISPSPSTAPPAPSTGGNQPASLVQVDASKPTTSVQLRLADGKRIILKLNHSHCVSDIRQHIVSSNPQYANSTFVLMKELTEETQTLEEASLLNAVVVQRF